MSSLAINYAIHLLARREYSEYELRCKMQEKAFSEEEITQTLIHCQQKNWQNDKRFAENYLHYRAGRGYGINRIKQELQQLKGIQTNLIYEVISESELDWSNLALSVLAKKFPDYRNIKDPRTKQKVWRYMLSHGFYAEEFADQIGSGDDSE